MKKLSLLAVNLMFFSQVLTACECSRVAYRFMDGIARYEFVAMIEVFGKENSSEAHGYSFTKVEIISQYAGKFVGKELRIIDCKGFECFSSLYYHNIGDKFIIKGFFPEGEDYLELGLCDQNTLHIENDTVKGWITRYRGRHWWKWTAFLKSITFGLVERDIHKFHPRLQKMKLQSFQDLLRENLN